MTVLRGGHRLLAVGPGLTRRVLPECQSCPVPGPLSRPLTFIRSGATGLPAHPSLSCCPSQEEGSHRLILYVGSAPPAGGVFSSVGAWVPAVLGELPGACSAGAEAHAAALGEFLSCAQPLSRVSNSLPAHGLQPGRLLCPWDSPGKNTRVGCYALLQGIFLTQELSRGLLHGRQILYWLSYQEISWVAFFWGVVVTFFFYCQKLDTSHSLNPAKPMGTHCTDIAAGGQIKFCAQGHTAGGRPRNPMHLPVTLRRGSQAARTRQPGHQGQKAGSIPRPSQQAILVGSPAEGPAPEALHPESWAQAGRRGRG